MLLGSVADLLVPSRRAVRPARLRAMSDEQVAAVFNRWLHRPRVFDAVVAEMSRRDRETERARRKHERDERRRARKRALREDYDLYVQAQFLAAEQQARGHLLNKAGKTAGVDPRSLFSGPGARARKYASEELRAFWDRHGRMTFTEFTRKARQSSDEAA